MKLLYCPDCNDMFNLSLSAKTCSCGKVSGMYTDNLNAIYNGGIPFCINNQDFVEAIDAQTYNNMEAPNAFYGVRFDAWICPANSKTFRKSRKGEWSSV